MSTSHNDVNGSASASAFWKLMDSEVGTIHCTKSTGENGADEHSMFGLGDDVQGAFVAAFSGLVRGCSQERTRQFLVNIVNASNSCHF